MLYKKAIIKHKAYYKSCRQYLAKLLEKAPGRYGLTKLIPNLPRIDLFKGCSFSYIGPTTWNSIPQFIRTIENIKSFKSALHKYL